MKLFKFVAISGLVLSVASAQASSTLETVSHVDLGRYLGKWYEVGHYQTWFQKNCAGSTAEYSLKKNGTVRVLNTCFHTDGTTHTAKGTAKVKDKVTNSKLSVSFFWPFSGKYWIIDLGPNYEYSVVSEPKKKYLFILSRTKTIDQVTFQGILKRLEEKGFDLSKIIFDHVPEIN